MDHNSLQTVEQTIREYLRGTNKIVVAIDGYSGIGKTWLLYELAQRIPDILAVNRDDFIKPRRATEQLLKDADDKSVVMELDWVDADKLRDFVNTFRTSSKPYDLQTYNSDTGEADLKKTFDFSKKILVVEGIFLLHPKLHADMFDLKIFLTGDMSAADERRIAREKARWGKDYFPETHPDSYFRLLKTAFKRYVEKYKPEQAADLVVRI